MLIPTRKREVEQVSPELGRSTLIGWRGLRTWWQWVRRLITHCDDLRGVKGDLVPPQNTCDAARGDKHVVNVNAAHQPHADTVDAHPEFGQVTNASPDSIRQLVGHDESLSSIAAVRASPLMATCTHVPTAGTMTALRKLGDQLDRLNDGSARPQLNEIWALQVAGGPGFWWS